MYNETQLQALEIFQNKEKKQKIKKLQMMYGTSIVLEEDAIHLEDLFRVAEEEWYKTELTIDGRILFFRLDQSDYVTLEESVDINKTLPLLSQPNLSEIVNLFSK